MPDRKTVMSWLDGLTQDDWQSFHSDSEVQQIAMAALELLEEQETVEPKKIKGYNPPMYTLYEYKCEKCESLMMNKQPFCMGCGKLVNWE